MTYEEWYEVFATKHKAIVEKLLVKGYTQEEIIEYFDFDNMVEKEPNFCLLYQEKKKCHDIKKLNCYLCACPHFRFNDKGITQNKGKTLYSYCSIDAKEGSVATYGDAMHQDCTKCTIPHHTKFIDKNFTYEWRDAMKDCNCG
ncbi:MAG: hypothetical protein JXQ67_06550 [Campylobacterales bacterium]|nr:hypothetical protein [Campylobacterales bacterium]